MPSLTMGNDMFDLDPKKINEIVGDCEQGNYSFGHVNSETGDFTPKYIGRSDTSLAREIGAQYRNFVVNGNRDYTIFKFDCADNIEGAYIKECHNYHDFQPQLDNEIHPASPGTEYPNLYCPIKGCEHSEAPDDED